jgi:hypothetical protein
VEVPACGVGLAISLAFDAALASGPGPCGIPRPSLADYVRGAAGPREAPQRANVAYAPDSVSASCAGASNKTESESGGACDDGSMQRPSLLAGRESSKRRKTLKPGKSHGPTSPSGPGIRAPPRLAIGGDGIRVAPWDDRTRMGRIVP